MYVTARGLKVWCEYSEGVGAPVMFLHGWGGDCNSFAGAAKRLAAAGKTVLRLDFPCFGKSDMPPPDFGIYDFADIVSEIIDNTLKAKPIVVGHSFGGRVGIILGACGKCEKLVLVDSAGLKPRRSPVYTVKVAAHKLKKKMGLKTGGGSADYKAMPDALKGLFVRVVNTHLDSLLKSVSCPTLIVWGENDRETPVYMAKKLLKNIKDAGLITLPGGHFSYIDSPEPFELALLSFAAG